MLCPLEGNRRPADRHFPRLRPMRRMLPRYSPRIPRTPRTSTITRTPQENHEQHEQQLLSGGKLDVRFRIEQRQ